ncbi:MAG: dTDP-4-dehydrorhamnose reductase [Rikenellaceae bacterium]
MSNILITGANGQLGTQMQIESTGDENNYIFTDLKELDITDFVATTKCLSDNNIDTIVNCAAYTNVDKAEQDIELCDKINHLAVSNLAKAAKEHNATLIHISTDYVFDGNNHTPYTEDEPTAPIGIYGKTKLMGEQSVINSECKHIIIRTSWLYSESGANFVKTMLKLTSERETLNVIFDQIGTPTYAGDLAKAIVAIINSDSSDKNGVYHFSNEGVCSWYDFAVEISSLAGNVCGVKPIHSDEYPSLVTRPHYSVLDKTKIKANFGLEIPHWRVSLRKCIKNLIEC